MRQILAEPARVSSRAQVEIGMSESEVIAAGSENRFQHPDFGRSFLISARYLGTVIAASGDMLKHFPPHKISFHHCSDRPDNRGFDHHEPLQQDQLQLVRAKAYLALNTDASFKRRVPGNQIEYYATAMGSVQRAQEKLRLEEQAKAERPIDGEGSMGLRSPLAVQDPRFVDLCQDLRDVLERLCQLQVQIPKLAQIERPNLILKIPETLISQASC